MKRVGQMLVLFLVSNKVYAIKAISRLVIIFICFLLFSLLKYLKI